MFIGLDLGTSGVKGLLMSGDQRVLAEASAPLTVSRPFAGWSEQSPADWIAATEQVMEQLAAQGLRGVRGIGLSGQMHGATLLDAADEVLRPCILWNDSRSFEEAAELDADPMFRRVTGNIVFAGFTAPKLMWVQRHEPALWDRVAKVLLPLGPAGTCGRRRWRRRQRGLGRWRWRGPRGRGLCFAWHVGRTFRRQ